LKAFPELDASIPYRSDARRNVGYLQAFADRADVVISVDDDNFPQSDSPFFVEHGSVGTVCELPDGVSDTGWFNLGCLLTAVDRHGVERRLFPRGFPYGVRGRDNSRVSETRARARVAVNAGLWLGEPDVDAISRLESGFESTSFAGISCWLGKGQRCPINSQNTAVSWQALPAYYFVLQRRPVGGLPIDRFGDIFSGYFVELCAEAVGERVRVGTPLVRQARNPHNLFRDLSQELPGVVLLESMSELLARPLTPAADYVSAYRELAERIDQWAATQTGFWWDASARAYFSEMTRVMRLWSAACVTLAEGEGALRVDRR
jgi:hypothetical protein